MAMACPQHIPTGSEYVYRVVTKSGSVLITWEPGLQALQVESCEHEQAAMLGLEGPKLNPPASSR